MIKIETKQDYYSAMAEIEIYLGKGFGSLSEAEGKRLEELSMAVEAWEKINFPIPKQASIPDLLNYIMRERNVTQSKLSEELDMSKSNLSEILSGKKKVSLDLIRSLHSKFKLDGNMLLELL